MEEKPTKVIKNGNTTVVIHCNLLRMTPEEQKQWFSKEMENGNRILQEINRRALDCMNN